MVPEHVQSKTGRQEDDWVFFLWGGILGASQIVPRLDPSAPRQRVHGSEAASRGSSRLVFSGGWPGRSLLMRKTLIGVLMACVLGGCGATAAPTAPRAPDGAVAS